jgi:hypothetical protein
MERLSPSVAVTEEQAKKSSMHQIDSHRKIDGWETAVSKRQTGRLPEAYSSLMEGAALPHPFQGTGLRRAVLYEIRSNCSSL